MSDLIRTFIAIRPPASWIEALIRLQRALLYRPGGNSVRWVGAEQLHITLEFLGNVEAGRVGELARIVTDVCATRAALRLTGAGLGCFPSVKKANVIWAGVGGDVERLCELQAALRAAVKGFGDSEDTKAFHPHLTLGRVKKTAFKDARRVAELVAGTAAPALGDWDVDVVCLIKSVLGSKGAEYSELAAASLGK